MNICQNKSEKIVKAICIWIGEKNGSFTGKWSVKII